MVCRDGTVYGCGSTHHGQLPYLKFSSLGGDLSSSHEPGEPRNEITQATCLKLPILQVLPSARREWSRLLAC